MKIIEMFSSDEVEIYSSSDTGLHFLLVAIIIFARRVMHAQQETLTMLPVTFSVCCRLCQANHFFNGSSSIIEA
jgi:hypothetical protein